MTPRQTPGMKLRKAMNEVLQTASLDLGGGDLEFSEVELEALQVACDAPMARRSRDGGGEIDSVYAAVLARLKRGLTTRSYADAPQVLIDTIKAMAAGCEVRVPWWALPDGVRPYTQRGDVVGFATVTPAGEVAIHEYNTAEWVKWAVPYLIAAMTPPDAG